MTKRRECYKETEIGVIPEDWEVFRICDIATFVSNGFVGTASPFYSDNEDSTLYLMGNNVRENYIDKRTLVRINDNFTEKYPKSKIFEGDMLTVQSGHIGTSCVVTKEFDKAHCHAVIITRFDKNQANPDYQAYYLNSNEGKNRLKSLFVGTTIKHINTKDLKVFQIPNPPLLEQQRIAKILSATDAHIEKLDKIIDDYQLLKKGMMKKLLTEGLGHTEFKETEIGRIPKEWEVKKFIDLSDKNDRYSFTGGPFGSDLKSSDYTDYGVRVIQLQNIGEGIFYDSSKIFTSIDKANQLMNCNIYPHDIILAKMADPVARACKMPSTYERYLMCSDGIRLKVDETLYDKDYCLYAINSSYFRKQAIENSTGTTRQRIGLNALRDLRILAPPLNEQKQIAKILVSIDNRIELFLQERDDVLQLKRALMDQLLTGKIRVNNLKA